MKYGKHRHRKGKTKPSRTSGTPRASAETRHPAGTEESAGNTSGKESRIKLQPWWERWKGRLEYELAELDEYGIRYERDADALAKGTIVLKLWFPLENGETIFLTAHYPDTYPYTRFIVKAPEMELGHHLAPFDKNLCLMGAATENWKPESTLYQVLEERLPVALKTGRSEKLEEVKGLEDEQAEPLSVYYPYVQDSIVLIDSDWSLDKDKTHGKLIIGAKRDTRLVLRGAVLDIKDDKNQSLIQSNSVFKELYPDRPLQCRWVRINSLIRKENPKEFFEALCELHPSLKRADWNFVTGGNFEVIGIIFPEEVTDWRKNSDGWMFLVRAKINTHSEEVFYFARTGRAGKTDLSARIPEVETISDKKVAVIGLGGVGWASALELARNGISGLRIVDDDTVEPGTTVRWGFGLTAAGRRKTDVIKEFIEANYPYTKVVAFDHRIGNALNKEGSDSEILAELFDGIDLIYDASAEVGIQQLLSDMAAEFNVPYICVSTRQGAWGGEVSRIRPGETIGCWMCLQESLKDGTIPPPPSDPEKMLQPAGCASPTFTGTSFDIQEVSLFGVRLAVSTLVKEKEDAYPKADWDVGILSLRENKNELVAPNWKTYMLEPHPLCSCQSKSA